jgi:hypothetical protein
MNLLVNAELPRIHEFLSRRSTRYLFRVPSSTCNHHHLILCLSVISINTINTNLLFLLYSANLVDAPLHLPPGRQHPLRPVVQALQLHPLVITQQRPMHPLPLTVPPRLRQHPHNLV